MILNIPTQLTLARLVMVPLVLAFIYLDWRLAAVAVYSLAAITDTLDGYLARKWNQSTAFGAFLDPVADKLMVAAVSIMLVLDYGNIWVMLAVIIIISREILISALREWMAAQGARDVVAVSNLGKLKTWLQMLALGFLIWKYDAFGLPVVYVGYGLLILAVLLTLYSMVDYFSAAWPALRDKANKNV